MPAPRHLRRPTRSVVPTTRRRVATVAAALAATVAVTGGGFLMAGGSTSVSASADADSVAPSSTSVDPEVAAALAEREQEASVALRISRAAARPALRAAEHAVKTGALPVSRQAVARGGTRTVEAADPRGVARGMLSDFGWSSDQFSCLDELYFHESGWDHTATNPTSGAYGIPQALPAEKLAASGADWRTNPETQLDWGLNYIKERYGSPCGAWSFWQSNNWY